MADLPGRTSADEDWQDIDTDGFSVLSLSTDVEDDEQDKDHQAAASCDSSLADGYGARQIATRRSFETDTTLLPAYVGPQEAGHIPGSQATDGKSTTSAGKDDKDEDDKSMRETDVAATAELPHSHSHSEDPEIDAAVASDGSNPEHMHKLITSNIKLLDEVVLVTALSELKVFDRLPELKAQCNKLTDQLGTLAPIARTYARHWRQQQQQPAQALDDDDEPLPLDPGLHDWLTRLRTAALSVQRYMQQVLQEQVRAEDKEMAYCITLLADSWRQMHEFLPIIEADFDEFQTAEMTFQSLTNLDTNDFEGKGKGIAVDWAEEEEDKDVGNRPDSPTVSSPQPLRRPPQTSAPALSLFPELRTQRHDNLPARRQENANQGIGRLRRELYSLKDQLGDSLDELRQLQRRRSTLMTTTQGSDRAASSSQHRLLGDTTASYDSLKLVLERLLSNSPSDWLDDGIVGAVGDEHGGEGSGGSHLSYAEFARISPDVVSLWRAQLREVTTDMFLARCRVDSVSWTHDPEGVLPAEERCGEVLADRLQALSTIADVLVPMFVRDSSGGGGGGG
ncbi:uncharacterized protein B0I36DRAFT_364513 [Microdochium trichocladiopsis]|uniref:Uncharacterized protein n=1 Tax=Microdochium trichocladiopsis TaxID=1682393 RepID=A0A9P8Y152_9PEZI|nr:uncharacterized protein B0I36DRAFT_364513 [Microdochium trichocladiopsis]KAH7027287.1 hypothetical protein B0I36DRAFT_364513 [Microdochium trichocladiopsis]